MSGGRRTDDHPWQDLLHECSVLRGPGRDEQGAEQHAAGLCRALIVAAVWSVHHWKSTGIGTGMCTGSEARQLVRTSRCLLHPSAHCLVGRLPDDSTIRRFPHALRRSALPSPNAQPQPGTRHLARRPRRGPSWSTAMANAGSVTDRPPKSGSRHAGCHWWLSRHPGASSQLAVHASPASR